jgi:Uncharacterized protein involved in outer membrane biogenesis
MKKFLKITAIVIASIIILLMVLPYAFRGKIKEVIISEGNKMLNAQFDFGRVNISLIRNFPKATISVKDIAVWGIEDFANDTLFAARNASVTVNLKSLFSDSGYDITKILLSGVNVKTIALSDGRVNWDIMKPSEEVETEDDNSNGFKVKLRSVKLSNSNFVYDDRGANMYISATGIGLGLSGDMTASEVLLAIKANIASLGVRYGGIAWISGAKVSADGNVDANFDNMRFTFSDNTTLSLNAITAGVEGMFGVLDDGYDMDIRLNTEKVGFKEILSMIPAVYAKDFSSLKADGNVSLSAWAKGVMTDDKMPAFNASLNVTGGSFRYPSLPKGVDGIEITASASSSGGGADNTIVDVKSMRFSIAGNPFAAAFRLATPISDPDLSAMAKGRFDLGAVKEIYPLEGMELNGVLNADFDFAGRYSYMESGEYDKLKASGNLGVKDMVIAMEGMPDIAIANSLFTFTPRYLQLGETAVKIGKSDITGDFRLDDYIGFIMKGDVLRGSASIRSQLLDVNELMGGETEEVSDSEDPLKAFEIPKNINMSMNASMKKVYFGNMDINNINGELIIRDGKLNMKNLSLETMGGSAVANGYYSTAAAGAAEPELNASFKMNNLLFSESFKTFEVIRTLAPIFENLKGSFSGDMSVNTKLDSLLNPKLDSFNAEGILTTTEIILSEVTVLDKLADLIKYEPLKNINTRDIKISFNVKNGRLTTKPFDIKMGTTNLNLSGTTGIDKTIDYRGKINIPASLGVLGGNIDSADFLIGGTFSDPKISLDTKGFVNQAVDVAKDRALEEIGDKLGIDISDAEKQRAALIEEAQKAGDKLVEEAKKKVQETVDKVEGRIAKLAAEKAGEKIVQEAEKQSAALVAKATEEGDKLVENAKQKQQ